MGKNTKKKKQNAGANSPGDQSALLPAGVEKKQAAESEEMMGMLEHDAVAEAASAVEEVTEEQTLGNRRMESVREVVWSDLFPKNPPQEPPPRPQSNLLLCST